MQKCVRVICTFWHLPSNGITVKIMLNDSDLLFEGKHFLNLISLKRWQLANKCVGVSFVDFDICHRMVSMQKFYCMTFTYILKVKIKDVNISEMVRVSAKMCGVFCRFWYFPSNSVNAKIEVCDIDLVSEGQNLKKLIYLKQ